MSTYAGSISGAVDGLGTTARFANPIGVTADGNGNVYVGDSANNPVRRITLELQAP